MASSAERDAYREKKMGDPGTHMVADEPEAHVRAMVAEVLNVNKPEVYVEAIEELEVYMGTVTTEILSTNEPETYLNTMVAKTFDENALAVKNDSMDWKLWIINSGCSSNFSPN